MPKISRIHWKKFEKFLFKIGCEFKRQRGDHMVYHKKGLLRPIVITRGKSLPEFIILNNLRILDVDRNTYLSIISKI